MPSTVTVEQGNHLGIDEWGREVVDRRFHVLAVDSFNSQYCVFHGNAEEVHSFLGQHDYKQVRREGLLEGEYKRAA